MVTSPENPRIIASASDDTTVRVWSLDPVHAKQPCVCLLGGEGHSWALLSAVSVKCVRGPSSRPGDANIEYQAFHSSGRYMLTAGHDQVVNLVSILTSELVLQQKVAESRYSGQYQSFRRSM